MMGSTALVNKALVVLLALTVIYFARMDYQLYVRVRDYRVRPLTNCTVYRSAIPCELDPLCTVTVKGMMLDHPNHYILSPLAAVVDYFLGISDYWTWLTPNAISSLHVLVAVAAGKCVASDSLSHRRLGVLLFQLRSWMDDLDGHVARKRAHVLGERSDVGSTGYIVDGVCDALGCVALVIGLFHFLTRNPTKRGYDKLQQVSVTSANTDTVYVATLKGSSWNKALCNTLLLIGHHLVISAAWNRYISLYQDLLENDADQSSSPRHAEELYNRQTAIFRSDAFWRIVLCWKLINFHAAMDYLLLAIFVDRVWEYLRAVRWLSYVVAILLAYVTEFHYTRVYPYLRDFLVEERESVHSTRIVAQS